MITMIAPEEAAALIRRHAPAPAAKHKALDEAFGAVLAADTAASFPMPPADNSAMDGFVVRARDTSAASAVRPVLLKIAGTLKAGDGRRLRLAPGTALRIMTGAFIPGDGDAVIPKEDARMEGGCLCVDRPVRAGRHIRRRGEEVRKGQVLLRKGTPLDPAAVGVLASFGFGAVKVFDAPRVTVLATGNELTVPGRKLGPGKIYDSNSWMIRSALLRMGVVPVRVLTLRDELSKVRRAVRSALKDSDCLILLGGVSVGDYDVAREALTLEKVRTVFWKVNQKPGKPLYFGRKGKKIVFGLPGNPAAAFTCFYEYAYPALLKMLGRNETGLERRVVHAAEAPTADDAKHLFLKARLSGDSRGGVPVARVLGSQGSHMLTSLLEADGFLRVPPGGGRAEARAKSRVGARTGARDDRRRFLMDFLPYKNPMRRGRRMEVA